MRRAKPKKTAPFHKLYVCCGCGNEYDPALGDPEGDIAPGTSFEKLPEEWTCPVCGEEKDMYIEA